ncbi:hypothetical protein [Lysinibacillus parviboronicapiens]|uniref:hypothetical protein n=1 Tax=Lysinibacillus parviboronicapiens TaxID=436516 RepID=UPI000D3A6290|nr:hypothetical protein [Lysinibacillus parviboronicapiens]
MRIVKLTLFYMAIIVLAMVLSLAGVRMSVALGFFALIVVAMIYRHIHILYRTNNMQLVDKFVRARQKQPFFAHIYAIAYGSRTDQIAILAHVASKNKQPTIKYNYLFNKALLEENLGAAKEAAQHIDKEPIKSYTACYIAALEGRTSDMHSDKLTQPWMQPAIEAAYAHQLKDKGEFERFAGYSIDVARGVQKYALIHTFEQMKTDITKS